MILFRLGRAGINLFDPKKILFVLWLFLLVFPKGGFKIGDVPITWGYLLLGTLSVFIHLTRRNYTLHNSRFTNVLCLLPFQAVSLGHLFLFGVFSIAMTISFLINFFFLPYVFFFLLSQNIESMDLNRFFRLFVKGVFSISLYGVFLFVFKQVSGSFIEIPFLTTNWSDLGMLEEKHINRGFAFKLISTYNNGNLYGICLLIFLPLYCYLETISWKKAVVKISLFLTFSRTVWIGLLFYELCYNVFVEKKRKAMINLLICSILLVFSLVILSIYYNFPLLGFLFDSSLGGRGEQLVVLQNLEIFSSCPFAGISEIVYAGVLSAFGMIGLFTFLIGMAGPLMIRLSKGSLTKIQKSMCMGIVNYLLVSCSDGGILFIPVMAFFWFLYSLLARENISQFTTDSRAIISFPQ